MLELIFQGFVEWLYGIVLEAWEHFASSLLDIMSMDFSYLEGHIAVLPTIRQALLAIGWALLLGNLIFQAAKSMLSGLGFEGEDPKLLFARTFVFSFLLVASPQICDLCLNMTSKMIEILRMPTAVQIVLADERSFAGLAGAWLLVTICGIIVMFQSFKLILEMAERYFILAMLTISAPLAFGVGGSKSTSEIFSGWCRMYGSMCLLMVLNVVFIKLLLSVLSYVPSGLDVLPWMVLVITIVKVAKKADAIITRIGLNPAMTGAPLGRSFPGTLTYIVARTAISNAARALGNGNSRNGSASGSRSGGNGSSANRGAAGSGGRTLQTTSGASGAAARNPQTENAKAPAANSRSGQGSPSYQQASYQNASQQNAAQQESQNQNTLSQYEGPQSAVTEQQAAFGDVLGSQVLQGGAFSEKSTQTRNTAVPVGTRRAPSHIKAPPGSAGSRFRVTRPAQNAQTRAGSAISTQTINNGSRLASGTTAEHGAAATERNSRSTTVLTGQPISSVVSGTAGRDAGYAPRAATETKADDPSRIGPAGNVRERTPATGTGGQSAFAHHIGAAGNKKADSGRNDVGKAAPVPGNLSGSRIVSEAGKALTLRSGTAESRSVRTGVTNTGEKAASVSVSANPARIAANEPSGASEARRTKMDRPGTAGTQREPNGKAASERNAASVISGTAGNTGRPLSGIHPFNAPGQPGSSGNAKAETGPTSERSPSVGRPAEGRRSESAGTQTVRQGPINSTMIAKEQNHITLNQAMAGDTSPGEITMSTVLPGSQTKERSTAGGTRSTLRPASDTQDRLSKTAETPAAAAAPAPVASAASAPPGKQTEAPQYGMAGSAPPKIADRSVAELRKEYAEGAYPATQRQRTQLPKTVRQERTGASAETRSIHRGQPATVRHGTAGNAAQAIPSAQASTEKHTATGPATRSSSLPEVQNRTGGKKAASTSSGMSQRFSWQAGRKTKRKMRRSGGKKNG